LIEPLTKPESSFIQKRKKLLKLWPITASILLLGIAFLTAWLFWNTPLLINPYAAIEQLNTQSIPDSTTSLMVAMLPIVMLMCLFLTVVLILFMFVAFSNEKRHMAIIERLLQSDS